MLWTRKPVSVYLKVRSKEPITPKQVRLVQEFLGEKMRRNFELIVLVDAITEVRAEEPPLYMQKPEKKDQVTKKITNQDIKKVRILKRKTKP
jgi:4-amino-4-deoxy-L-arabinose transferase-like glycosyltransferase